MFTSLFTKQKLLPLQVSQRMIFLQRDLKGKYWSGSDNRRNHVSLVTVPDALAFDTALRERSKLLYILSHNIKGKSQCSNGSWDINSELTPYRPSAGMWLIGAVAFYYYNILLAKLNTSSAWPALSHSGCCCCFLFCVFFHRCRS